MKISDLQKLAYTNALKHGWHEEDRKFGELIALCHSELSEALEEFRNGRSVNEEYIVNGKPEGIPSELADVVIRIADMCGKYNIDLEGAINRKMEFNISRPFKHGNKLV